MKVPYSIQCALFAPALLMVLFALKVSCPVATGQGCFADVFMPAAFFPLAFVYQAFGELPSITSNEVWLMLAYWTVVGALVGVILDLYKAQSQY